MESIKNEKTWEKFCRNAGRQVTRKFNGIY